MSRTGLQGGQGHRQQTVRGSGQRGSHLSWGTPAGPWPSMCWRCSSAQPGTPAGQTQAWMDQRWRQILTQAAQGNPPSSPTHAFDDGPIKRVWAPPHHKSGFWGFFRRDFSRIARALVSWPAFSSSRESSNHRGMEWGHFFSCHGDEGVERYAANHITASGSKCHGLTGTAAKNLF